MKRDVIDALFMRQRLASRLTRLAVNEADRTIRAGEDNALSTAVRGAKMALLTQVYLAAHTPSEAAAHGIGAGAQLAAE